MSDKELNSDNSEIKSKSKGDKAHKPAVPFMQNRELSWLDFNKRVLDQGADPSVPLLERLGFVSIYWSNLQEFFMIRVGSLTDLSLLKKPIFDTKTGMSTKEQLSAIYRRCHELNPYYENCYETLRGELAKQGIVNLRHKQLNDEQREFLHQYFHINIMPFLSPQIVNPRHPFPHLENAALYVIVRLDESASASGKSKNKAEKLDRDDKSISGKDGKKGDKSKGKGDKASKNMGAEGVTLGIIPMPKQCPRIIRLPGDGMQFILLENAIEMFVDEVFSMYKVKHSNLICVTRNADLDATEGADEQGEDYREHIKKILKKRTRLMPVRLESEKELSATVKPLLLERLNLESSQTFVSKVPLDMSYVFELSSMVDDSVRERLTYAPFKPQWPISIKSGESILDQVAKHDILLSYPYESMDAFVQMLREAAGDPNVVSIKITLYRLAKQSHLAEALIAAAEAGKEVTALFELRARFDESNNIEWSQRFEQAGCNVIYGFRDYKVHSKICCITRRTNNSLQYITQLGTGNYNEKTARLYTDFSYITANPTIGFEAAAFFRNMTLENVSDEYKVLWVAPLQIKQNIIAGIDEQIALAKEGKPASLFFKTNSITDKEIIEKIVEASQAGVQCTLLVRGISCIVPGIPGYTDNVCVVSIVGRLLEHSRIYIFGSFNSDFKMYLSSADLMTRNMDKRIEIAWPVISPELRDQIVGYIGTCMADTAKLRDLLPNRTYTDIGFFAKPERQGGEVIFFDSQNYLIKEASGKQMVADEILASKQNNDTDKIRDLAEDEIALDKIRTEAEALKEAKEKAMGKEKPKEEQPESKKKKKSEKKAKEAAKTQQVALVDTSNLPGIEGLYAPEVNPDGTFTIPGLSGETLKLERVGGPVLEEEAQAEFKPAIDAEIEQAVEKNLLDMHSSFDIPIGDNVILPNFKSESEPTKKPVSTKEPAPTKEQPAQAAIEGITVKEVEKIVAKPEQPIATEAMIEPVQKAKVAVEPETEHIPQSKPLLGTPEGSPFVEVPEEPTHIEMPDEEKPSFFKRLFKKN